MSRTDELKQTISDRLGVKSTAAIDSTQLASLLQVRASTLDVWTSRNRGPQYLKVGRRRLYRISDVAMWLAARVHETRESREAAELAAEKS